MRSCIAVFGLVLVLITGCTTDDSTESELHGGSPGGPRCRPARPQGEVFNLQSFTNEHGRHATYSTRNKLFLDTENPFFQELGSNGRTCATCHSLESAFGLNTDEIRRRFEESCGTDPLFRPVDGTNNPLADINTLSQRRLASSLLLDRGVIRIQIPLPTTRDYDLIAVDDPTFNDITQGITVFRRPLMSTNLKFLGSTMWDSREANLSTQALHATQGHAQADRDPTPEDIAAIVDFETNIFTTQIRTDRLGFLFTGGAEGDPISLSTEEFFIDQNRPPVPRPIALAVITNNVMTLYDTWANSSDESHRQVKRGQDVFNFAPLINPDTGAANTCSNCHNHFNSGAGTQNVIEAPFGATKSVHISNPEHRIPGMPLYTFRQRAAPNATRMTTDPGRGLVTGKFADIGGFKMPGLRGLSARAPYFHNGMSRTLEEVVDHYDVLFRGNFTLQQKRDLVAFLKTL